MAEQDSFSPESPDESSAAPIDTEAIAANADRHLQRQRLEAAGIDPDLQGADIARAALGATSPDQPPADGRPAPTAHEDQVGRIPTPAERDGLRADARHRRFDELRSRVRPDDSTDRPDPDASQAS